VLPARDFARADRVVTWASAGGTLSVYAPGQLKSLATSGALADLGAVGESPRGVAWAGDTALVWGAGKLAAIDAAAGGKSRWEIDFPKLPTLEVVRGNDDAAGAAVPIQQPNNGQIILPNGVIVNNRGGGRVRVLGGGMVIQGNVIINGQQQGIVQAAAQQQPPAALPGQPVPPQPGGGEQVADVRPVGDRVLVATTTGRVVSLDLTDGKVAWQTRLADGMPDRLVATEDFTVVKVSDDLTIRLFALDTFTGKLLGSKAFSRQAATPVNLALAADGTLVYTMPDRLCLKDLYKISQNWDEELKSVNGPPNVNLYAGATQPGQLLISEGRILALADSGGMANVQANIKYVRVHSLETGQPVQLKYDQPGDGKHQVDLLLTSGTRDWNVLLRTVGSHLYVVGPQSVYGYNLDDPAENWKGAVGNGIGPGPGAEGGADTVNLREAFVGQNHLVLLDQSAPTGDGAAAHFRLYAIGRYRSEEAGAPATETGRVDYVVAVNDPAGVLPQWQAVDGGFYYATADGKVHMLVGGAQDAPAGK
jgi:outer membrane protein assembly factor BamB